MINQVRAKELAVIKRKIPKIDPAFTYAIKNLEPCTFGVEKSREKCEGSITVEKVGRLSLKELQSIGLTGAKVRTIDELTQATLSGEINFRRFTHLGDEEIIQELVPLFGIGRWTVEMFLIFQLGRLDVWPVDDLAVRRGWDNLHKNTEPIKAKVLQQLGEPFIGMRSVVAWYCWRAS